VRGAGRVYPVEDVVRPAVPEAPEVEDGVHGGGGVATRHLPDVHAVEVEHRIGHGGAAVAGTEETEEAPLDHPLGAGDVPGGDREARGGQHRVRHGRVEDAVGTRVEDVSAPGVGPRLEVTGGARLHAVTSRLHVPEERFAELNRRAAVRDEVPQVGRQGYGRAFQRFHI